MPCHPVWQVKSVTRLTLPLLSCALLLTACPSKPLPVDVPSDPSLLHGRWQGRLETSTRVRTAVMGEGRVYLLQTESADLYGAANWSGRGKTTETLVVLDAGTGQELRRLNLDPVASLVLRFREAQGGQPARLLLLNTASSVLSELDPVSLTTQRETVLPAALKNASLSRDGRWLMASLSQVSTSTFEPVALPESVQAVLKEPTNSSTRYHVWQDDQAFLSIYTRPNTNQSQRQDLLSVTTGKLFQGQAKHPSRCGGSAPFFFSNPNWALDLTDGGAALAYSDGTLELRDADDRLRQLVDFGDCQARSYRVDGDTVTAATMSSLPQKIGSVRASDGQILTQRTITLRAQPWQTRLSLLAPGVAVFTRADLNTTWPSQPAVSRPDLVALRSVDGTNWQTDGPEHVLQLDTQAVWQSQSEYLSQGTATLDGEKLNFKATVRAGSQMEFRAQTTPQSVAPVPPTWQAELTRADGTPKARMHGYYWTKPEQQVVALELLDQGQDFAFLGWLDR